MKSVFFKPMNRLWPPATWNQPFQYPNIKPIHNLYEYRHPTPDFRQLQKIRAHFRDIYGRKWYRPNPADQNAANWFVTGGDHFPEPGETLLLCYRGLHPPPLGIGRPTKNAPMTVTKEVHVGACFFDRNSAVALVSSRT